MADYGQQWYLIRGQIPYELMLHLVEQQVLRLGVDNSLAVNLVKNGHWSKNQRMAYIFWHLAGNVIFISSIVLSFTWHWWMFIVGWFLSGVVDRANDKSASNFVLNRGLSDQFFYKCVMDNGGWNYLANIPQEAFDEQYLHYS